ncbi:hypothetical protein N9L02_00665 [Gammaproteobacteria bacterium]|nr:hypothetical protein [Gammaproteobacteria bacterium]
MFIIFLDITGVLYTGKGLFYKKYKISKIIADYDDGGVLNINKKIRI